MRGGVDVLLELRAVGMLLQMYQLCMVYTSQQREVSQFSCMYGIQYSAVKYVSVINIQYPAGKTISVINYI